MGFWEWVAKYALDGILGALIGGAIGGFVAAWALRTTIEHERDLRQLGERDALVEKARSAAADAYVAALELEPLNWELYEGTRLADPEAAAAMRLAADRRLDGFKARLVLAQYAVARVEPTVEYHFTRLFDALRKLRPNERAPLSIEGFNGFRADAERRLQSVLGSLHNVDLTPTTPHDSKGRGNRRP